MGMPMSTRSVGRREVRVREGSDVCLITFYSDFNEDSFDDLSQRIDDITIVAVRVDDWNDELSPWSAPPIRGNEEFGGNAPQTLSFITDELIPEVGCESYIIGGYSMAGLFSLWACYNTDAFDACAAVSPSVWFPGWDAYIDGREMRARHVYLSMGDREAKVRDRTLSKVTDMIQKQFDTLSGSMGDHVKMEWNEGNHFDDPMGRQVKGFLWAVDKVSSENRVDDV